MGVLDDSDLYSTDDGEDGEEGVSKNEGEVGEEGGGVLGSAEGVIEVAVAAEVSETLEGVAEMIFGVGSGDGEKRDDSVGGETGSSVQSRQSAIE